MRAPLIVDNPDFCNAAMRFLQVRQHRRPARRAAADRGAPHAGLGGCSLFVLRGGSR